MTDNPHAAETLVFALPGHRVVSLAGRDAVAFAQAQFMNDVTALAAGHWQWNGWLTPKGRVIALFALLKLDAERLLLIVADVDPVELVAKLQQYVFRSKITIEVAEDRSATGSFSAPDVATGATFPGDADGGIELDLGGDGGTRTLRIVAAPAAQDANAVTRWAAFDLEHGLPRLDASQAGQWTPQQLSLGRLQAYSIRKGCYPGQEIVARTHFLGQAKRGLVLIECEQPIRVGSEVRNEHAVVGTVASAAGILALAVLPLEGETSALQVDGIAAVARPLSGGLAR